MAETQLKRGRFSPESQPTYPKVLEKVLELKEGKLADHTSSGRSEHQMRSFSKAGRTVRMVRMVRICQDSRYGEDGEDGQDGEDVQ